MTDPHIPGVDPDPRDAELATLRAALREAEGARDEAARELLRVSSCVRSIAVGAREVVADDEKDGPDGIEGEAEFARIHVLAISRLHDLVALADGLPDKKDPRDEYAEQMLRNVDMHDRWAEEARLRAEAAEAQLAELRKRSEVTRAWITETCIANRGRHGAVEESLQRLRRAAHEVFDGWGDRFRGDAKLHFVLQIERPTEPQDGG